MAASMGSVAVVRALDELDATYRCPRSASDAVFRTGLAVALVVDDPAEAMELAYQKLCARPFCSTPEPWARVYTDAALFQARSAVVAAASGHADATPSCDWEADVVFFLDKALLIAGGMGRQQLIERVLDILKPIAAERDGRARRRAHGRRRLDSGQETNGVATPPPCCLPSHRLYRPVPLLYQPTLAQFEALVSADAQPVLVVGAIDHWPALQKWFDVDSARTALSDYFLEQTLGGRRLVPVEIGGAYTDEDWSQRLMTVDDFGRAYMAGPRRDGETGYLAQHDIFGRVPALRADIALPDYCYCALPPTTAGGDKVDINVWIGPANTVSSLHHDPKHNLLCQVAGTKYVRMFPPHATPLLYPRGRDPATGVDMANTSRVDVREAMQLLDARPHVWLPGMAPYCPAYASAELDRDRDERRATFRAQFPAFERAPYVEAVLEPGDCLYLPPRWWHYVQSVRPSCSVSFWFAGGDSGGGDDDDDDDDDGESNQ